MDKRGFALSLTALVGIILAISGAVLLAYMGKEIFTLVFPPVEPDIPTQNSIDDIVKTLEVWNKQPQDFLTTTIPFYPGYKDVVVFFGKGDSSAGVWKGHLSDLDSYSVTKPRVKECVDRACACVYFMKDASNCADPKLDTASFLGCKELPGIGRVLSPAIYGEAFGTIMIKALSNSDLARADQINGGTKLGQHWYGTSENGAGYEDIFNQNAPIKDVLKRANSGLKKRIEKITFANPAILGVCKATGRVSGYGNPIPLYLEQATLKSGEKVLFMTHYDDPTRVYRSRAFSVYKGRTT